MSLPVQMDGAIAFFAAVVNRGQFHPTFRVSTTFPLRHSLI
jgi:hypothetical protein